MKYKLVKPNGNATTTHDFGDIAPPVLAANKGRWVPDIDPVYNPRTHKLDVAEPVPAGASSIPYNIVPLAPAKVARFAKEDAFVAEMADMKNDAFVKQFVAMTPADLVAYVNAEVTDVQGARVMLRKFGRVLLTIAKREFIND